VFCRCHPGGAGDDRLSVRRAPGLIARLILPADLTKAEAKRLAAFVETIAIETPLLITAPTEPLVAVS
jgi:hypothetical protein